MIIGEQRAATFKALDCGILVFPQVTFLRASVQNVFVCLFVCFLRNWFEGLSAKILTAVLTEMWDLGYVFHFPISFLISIS